VKTLIDFDAAPVFAIPMLDADGHDAIREGMLIEGPQGWGEFSPLDADDDRKAQRWLIAAMEPGTVGWPDPVRGRIAVSVSVFTADAAVAQQVTVDSGCRAADVRVADHPGSLAEDILRVEAVRDALGPEGAIRCNVGGRWDVDTAVAAIAALDAAARGLEYVTQPCRTVDESAAVRRRTSVRIAALLLEPPRSSLTEAADVAVLCCGPLGGARRALRVAETCGLPCVVSSTLETSIGLAAGLALAGALPELPFACGLGTRRQLTGDVVAPSRSLLPVDGYLPVAPMAASPDPGALAHCALTDPRRVGWWRGRLRTAVAAI
jgi:o-succinylbenzoate synthase